MSTKIDNWDFLVGKWESVPETHVGEPDGAKTYMKIEPYPSNQYFSMRSRSEVNDQLVTNGLSVIYFDNASNNYKLKTFFGMGFVVNYEELEHSDNKIVLEAVSVESQPPDFGDSDFRYTITKKGDDLFDIHLEMKPPGQEYFSFWRSDFERTN